MSDQETELTPAQREMFAQFDDLMNKVGIYGMLQMLRGYLQTGGAQAPARLSDLENVASAIANLEELVLANSRKVNAGLPEDQRRYVPGEMPKHAH